MGRNIESEGSDLNGKSVQGRVLLQLSGYILHLSEMCFQEVFEKSHNIDERRTQSYNEHVRSRSYHGGGIWEKKIVHG